MKNTIKLIQTCFLLTLFFLSINSQAQTARSLYFIDNAPARLQLNPALQPMRGYFNIPTIGAIGISVVSDPLSVQDFMDILEQENDFLNNDKLFNKLKTNNNLNLNMSIDLISLGFYSGKGFWTINIGTKVLLNTSIPKSLFEFARSSNDLNSTIQDLSTNFDIQKLTQELDKLENGFQIKDLKINANAFAEVGVGYSRPVSSRFTIGGRVKFLVGMGNIDAHVDKMDIHLNRPENLQDIQDLSDISWHVTTQGGMEISMEGIDLSTNTTENYIEDIDFDTPGIGGFGAGLDLGIAYNAIGNLILSAALTDIGFISWKKSVTTSATVNEDHDYSADQEGTDIFDYDLIQFKEDETVESRTTSLETTLNIGAEYTFFNRKLGIGLLHTTRFQKIKSFSELTASANFHPNNWFATTLSYSFIHSDFKTFGLGFKFGPIFLASDYMITGDFKSINRFNAYLGVSIPLGKKRQL